MKKLLLLFVYLPLFCLSQECPPQGDSKSLKDQASDLQKNRMWFPDKSKAKIYDFSTMLKDGIKDTGAVAVEAYITSAKISGLEACECHDTAKASRDYHIFIAAEKGDELGTHNQVVEISRYSRKFNPSLTFQYVKSLVGHKVRIYGYTFIDLEHKGVIGSKNQWRAGLQEIHPVFFIEKLD